MLYRRNSEFLLIYKGFFLGKHTDEYNGLILLAAYSTADFFRTDIFPPFRSNAVKGQTWQSLRSCLSNQNSARQQESGNIL